MNLIARVSADRVHFNWKGWAVVALSFVSYAVLALAGGAVLTGCGGGDEDEPEAICYVEGEPHPAHSCK